MKNRDGSEPNDHYATPRDLYAKLDAEFHFDFDPCPLHSPFDGLSASVNWGRSNFVNPPYNAKDKPRFIKRAYEEWMGGATCVLLIPAAVSTKQFHDLILPNAEVRFLRGRLKFNDGKTCGKHDSMVVVFKARPPYTVNAPDGFAPAEKGE
jgi:site-specific DNA-methyltransferase (adenine-specific)